MVVHSLQAVLQPVLSRQREACDWFHTIDSASTHGSVSCDHVCNSVQTYLLGTRKNWRSTQMYQKGLLAKM